MISRKSISREVRFFSWCMWHQISEQGAQKNCAREFLVLPALQICSCELVVFMNGRTFILTKGWALLHLY